MMSRMMTKLPSIVVRYRPRNRRRNMPCCSDQMGCPRRKNSDMCVWFSCLISCFVCWG